MSTIGKWPLASALDFLRGSDLDFRLIDVIDPKFYEDIRYISTVAMRGFIGFLAPDTFDDNLYNTLTITVSISNFPSSARVTMTRTIIPGSDDSVSFVYVPSQAQFETDLEDAAFPSVVNTTTKTQTLMIQEMESILNSTVRFELSNLVIDPGGSSKSVRFWQRLMLSNLAAGRVAIESSQVGVSEDDRFVLDWSIVENGTFSSLTKGLTYLFVPPRVPGLVSDAPPTGALPPIHGLIIQIQRGLNDASQLVLQDLLGVEGSHYYPGGPTDQQLVLIPADDSMMSKIPTYRAPDQVYRREEALSCSDTRHRIHQSPVVVRHDVRTVVLAGYGGSHFPIEPIFGALGPDVYPFASTPTTGNPVDSFNRVHFDNPCPANVIPDFWNLYSDDFVVDQIYESNAATNINGFVIPS